MSTSNFEQTLYLDKKSTSPAKNKETTKAVEATEADKAPEAAAESITNTPKRGRKPGGGRKRKNTEGKHNVLNC